MKNTLISISAALACSMAGAQIVSTTATEYKASPQSDVVPIAAKKADKSQSAASTGELKPLTVDASASSAPVVARAEAVAPVPPSEVPAVGRVWEIRLSDGTLSKALLRWSRESGVPILYEAPTDLSAVAARYDGDIKTALDAVLTDTANGPYPLHGCDYDNAVRVLHYSKSCDQ